MHCLLSMPVSVHASAGVHLYVCVSVCCVCVCVRACVRVCVHRWMRMRVYVETTALIIGNHVCPSLQGYFTR